jgi:hypothetical protein
MTHEAGSGGKGVVDPLAPMVIECPICGIVRQLPPYVEGTVVACRGCKTDLTMLIQMGGAGPVTLHKKSVKPKREPWKVVALAGLLWGLIGAVAAGAIAGGIDFAINPEVRSLRPLFAIINMAATPACIIFSVFVVLKRLQLGLLKSVGISAAISLVVSLLSFAVEVLFISLSDLKAWQTALIAVMAGAVIGAILWAFLSREE